MSADTPLFRVRWTLRATRPLALPRHQYAVLYAVLCEAGRGDPAVGEPQVPTGLYLTTSATTRDTVAAGESFDFGATLVAADPAQAAGLLHHVSRGLARHGRDTPTKPVALGGNFELIEVADLVAGTGVAPDGAFRPLPRDRVVAEIDWLLARGGEPLTLRFLSPLKLERPAAEAVDGHQYADADALNVGQFLRAVQKRLTAVGLPGVAGDPPLPDTAVTLVENRLVWLGLKYGDRDQRRPLSGAVGRLRLLVHDPAALVALVWGQYTRVGRNPHFGLGRYRIEELGPEPFA